MSALGDGFSVYLRNLDVRDVGFEVVNEEDSRHVLHITTSVSLYIRPSRDDLPSVIEGLRKLAATATEMAEALSNYGTAGGDLAGQTAREPKVDLVPWPTGLCGHQVPPGAWAAGFTRCRDCTAALVSDPENLAQFDAAARQLSVAPARPEDLDDADGGQ